MADAGRKVSYKVRGSRVTVAGGGTGAITWSYDYLLRNRDTHHVKASPPCRRRATGVGCTDLRERAWRMARDECRYRGTADEGAA